MKADPTPFSFTDIDEAGAYYLVRDSVARARLYGEALKEIIALREERDFYQRAFKQLSKAHQSDIRSAR